jgi:hypothetical protein
MIRLAYLVEAMLLVTGASAQDLLVVRQPAAGSARSAFPTVEPCVDGSEIIRISDDGTERVLTDGFSAACDPAVSFDGLQVLFAGRRGNIERNSIWRMDADGSNPVRITDGAGAEMAPLWIGPLFHLDDTSPSDRIAYLATGHGWVDEATGKPSTALVTADLDGGHALRISYHPRSDLDPDVLANGRLLFPMGQPGRDGSERLSLMAVNNDGTDLMAFDDDHGALASPHAVRVGHDGRVYFVEADGHSPLGGGDIAFVTLRRPLHSRRLLAAGGDGAFLDPLPMADGDLLASFRRPGPDAVYELYRIDPATGERFGLVSTRPGFDIVDAQELAPHPRVKGRSSVVDTTKTTGVFYCISSHITDRPELERLRAGDASVLRVIEGVPIRIDRTARSNDSSERILGEVALEPDGSFHIEVPSATPIRFALLDDGGSEIARQETWTWVMPREWRGCIGCHEDREMVVPNILADAVVKPAVQFDRALEEAP